MNQTERLAKATEYVRTHGYITVEDYQYLFGSEERIAQGELSILVTMGVLERHRSKNLIGRFIPGSSRYVLAGSQKDSTRG